MTLMSSQNEEAWEWKQGGPLCSGGAGTEGAVRPGPFLPPSARAVLILSVPFM